MHICAHFHEDRVRGSHEGRAPILRERDQGWRAAGLFFPPLVDSVSDHVHTRMAAPRHTHTLSPQNLSGIKTSAVVCFPKL